MNGFYFAYGSNLDETQMRERCPTARRGLRAVLPDHALSFGGFSHRWGGAVASVLRAPGARVHGLLYAIGAEDIAALDRFEGHPFAYERVQRIVVDENCRRRRVFLYLQPEDTFEFWQPAPDYYAVLRSAYAKLGFDRKRLAAAAGVAT
jgi:hypothetical protein